MKPRWHLRITRDLVLFIFGLAGVGHETLLHSGQERPELLLIFAACMGLPVMLRSDEHKHKGGK